MTYIDNWVYLYQAPRKLGLQKEGRMADIDDLATREKQFERMLELDGRAIASHLRKIEEKADEEADDEYERAMEMLTLANGLVVLASQKAAHKTALESVRYAIRGLR